jgi:periplasmic protein TonB
MAYSGAYKEDRAKALAGVLAVHVVLAAVILTGLNVRNVRHVVDTLKTFDIKEIVPPPPPPQPQPQAKRAKEEEGAAGKKAEPSPIVAPKPKIVVPARPPVVAAPVAGTGNARTAGAATSGTGTGAGGSGNGRGGGGTGDFSGFRPARLTANLSRGDYRRLVGNRSPFGSAVIAIGISEAGRISTCQIARSSGDPTIDAGLCPLASSRLRFDPARDDRGQPISYRYNYTARWAL